MDILCLGGKSPLLVRNNQVNFGDILSETSKSSAFWDIGVDSHLKWLLLFSPKEVAGGGGGGGGGDLVSIMLVCVCPKVKEMGSFSA